MIYTTYDSNGEILTTIFISGEDLESNTNGNPYIEGSFNSNDYYIDINTKQPVAKGIKTNINDTWDIVNKCWVPNLDRERDDARIQRDNLLLSVDRVNPVWYNSLTVEQQTELAQYRQALLDVPEQTGFPTDVVWPTKPTWL